MYCRGRLTDREQDTTHARPCSAPLACDMARHGTLSTARFAVLATGPLRTHGTVRTADKLDPLIAAMSGCQPLIGASQDRTSALLSQDAKGVQARCSAPPLPALHNLARAPRRWSRSATTETRRRCVSHSSRITAHGVGEATAHVIRPCVPQIRMTLLTRRRLSSRLPSFRDHPPCVPAQNGPLKNRKRRPETSLRPFGGSLPSGLRHCSCWIR